MSNYYTPSLEEFHLGFRYEYGDRATEGASTEWVKEEVIIFGLIERILEVRVKYLDDDDIEELGWKINSDDYYFKPKGIGEQYFLEKVKEDTWCITYEDHTGEIEEVEQLFLGKIKNYNELKKIMEWTGIK